MPFGVRRDRIISAPFGLPQTTCRPDRARLSRAACEIVHKHREHYRLLRARVQPTGWEDDVVAMIGDITGGVHSLWGPFLAFAAGVVSFASPCVLPLVPGYLSFVTAGRGELKEKRQPILPIVLFILGFASVFTLLGVFAGTALYRWLKSATGERVAGVIVLAFGAFMLLYAFRARLPWLYREERPLLSRVKPGGVGAFPLGMAFAIGWTPCIGPVLGAIFTLAGAQGGAGHGAFLLFVYSLGLGIPFLLLGLGVGRLMKGLRFFSRHYQWFAGIGGAVMVVIGVLLIAGAWTRLTAPLFRFANRLNLPI